MSQGTIFIKQQRNRKAKHTFWRILLTLLQPYSIQYGRNSIHYNKNKISIRLSSVWFNYKIKVLLKLNFRFCLSCLVKSYAGFHILTAHSILFLILHMYNINYEHNTKLWTQHKTMNTIKNRYSKAKSFYATFPWTKTNLFLCHTFGNKD